LESFPSNIRDPKPRPLGGERTGFLQIHSAVFLFGFSGLLGKLIRAAPSVIVFGRTFFASAALLVYLCLLRRRPSLRSGRDGATLLLSGIVLAAHWFAFFQSIHLSSVSLALITFGTFPLWIVFLEPIFFRERLGTVEVMAAATATAGMALVLPGFDPADRTMQGALWGLFAGASFAFLSLLNRWHVRRYPPLVVAFFQLGFAAAVGAAFALPQAASVSGTDLLLLFLLGIVCTAAAQTLYIGSLRYIRARTAGVIVALEPVYGILLAMILLGELPAPRTALGGLIILGAAYTVMVRKSRTALCAKEPVDP
jgi:drug/metabolite transporter (DMT)-like permease